MVNLIKSDLYKLFKSKAFYVCIVILILASMLTPIMYNVMQKYFTQLSEENPDLMGQMVELDGGTKIGVGMSTSTLLYEGEVDATWFINKTFADNTFVFVMAIFVAMFITREFSHHTIRNVVSKGFDRKKIYLSKVITLSIATIIMGIIMILSSGISSILVFGVNEISLGIILNLLGLIGVQLLITIAITCLFIMVSMITRSVALTITINIAMLLFVELILQLFNYIIGNDVNIQKYWLLSNLAEMSELTVQSGDVLRCIMCAISYIIISTIIGIAVFKRKDIE